MITSRPPPRHPGVLLVEYTPRHVPSHDAVCFSDAAFTSYVKSSDYLFPNQTHSEVPSEVGQS